MTVIKINAITVPKEGGDELARRFAARAGAVDHAEGFEGFELLKPSDDRTTWLVVTRWRDEASFEAWVKSPAFAHGHQGATGPVGGGGHPGAAGGHPGAAGGHPGGHPGAAGGHPGGGAPVAMQSELWSYEPVLGRKPGDA